MSKINILDSSIYNRIAAGEVVERPSSIIKELVENSLDAGATHIVIEIQNGGTKSIKVSDNGKGIEFEDLTKAFLPHATSKINSVEDLDNISTLGFRGEALASIGSVSQVCLSSKTLDSEFGGEIQVEGGKISKPIQKGVPNGTYITVNNLFYNTPARAKFLKSDRVEESYITNIISRFILSNPNIAFKYVADSRIIYQTQGLDLTEAIFVVYGKETVKNILEVNYQQDNIKISGFVGTPIFSKPNKTYQTLVINGRYVINALVSTAVYNAFENYIMKGRFPFFVLHMSIPYDQIDVNVHPNKLDVRFQASNHIYTIINNAVATALLKANNILNISGEEYIEQNNLTDIQDNKTDLNINNNVYPEIKGHSFSENSKEIEHNTMQDEQKCEHNTMQNSVIQAMQNATIYNSRSFNPSHQGELRQDNGLYYDIMTKVKEIDQTNNLQVVEQKESFLSSNNIQDYRIVGSLFKTYIIVESQDSAYFIDQHAAHERLIYDNFCALNAAHKNTSQDLLVPYSFKVNSIEENLIQNNLNAFKDLGFEIEEFGNLTYRIKSVPLDLYNINLQEFIEDCLKNINKISNTNEAIKHFLATSACKAAVKAGQELKPSEINTLINMFNNSSTTLLCPHGRPICVKISKSDMDKWFKRII